MHVGGVESFAGQFQHHGVAIEANQPPASTDLLENLLTVATRTDRSIHHREPLVKLQVMQNFPRHNGHMNGLRHEWPRQVRIREGS